MTHIFNEQIKITGVEIPEGRLQVDQDPVENLDTLQLLDGILKELKIMNIHLSLLTDASITNREVE